MSFIGQAIVPVPRPAMATSRMPNPVLIGPSLRGPQRVRALPHGCCSTNVVRRLILSGLHDRVKKQDSSMGEEVESRRGVVV